MIDSALILDISKHIFLSVNPITFILMSLKEFVDVFNGYYEPIDWISNGFGLYCGIFFKKIYKTT